LYKIIWCMTQLSNRSLFFENLAQTSAFPLAIAIDRAEGIYLYSTDNKQYIDFIAGIAVSNVGHRHPHVLAAIEQQLSRYMHVMVYGEYVLNPQVQLAAALAHSLAHIPSSKAPIDNIYLTNSGTEAVEGAMKLAKRYTGRSQILACHNAYHGASQGALSLSGSEHFKSNFRPLLPDIQHVTFGCFEQLKYITERSAAIVIEVVQGEAGVRLAPAGYMQALQSRCTAMGCLLILDEIQTGFGRTGSFWAFEQQDIYPDILLSAKGMGGGMPIGAFMAPKHIMACLRQQPILGHITTFGGHPVSAAASLATLQVIETEQLTQSVAAKATLIKTLLQSPKIVDIRHAGLMMAVEFESFDLLKKIIDKALSLGLITDWFLFCDNSMRIAPPLTITKTEIKEACHILNRAMAAV
jgi:acetylornithine/succinyldiaminopimelate/putrescine aminotransferase